MGDCWDGFKTFVAKFFSLIIALLNAVGVLIMGIGSVAHIADIKRFKRLEVAHALAAFVAALAALGLFYIPFTSNVSVAFIRVESLLIILALALVSLSVGLLGQQIEDCVQGTNFNSTQVIQMADSHDTSFCNNDGAIFAGGVILLLSLCIALGDVHRQLVNRIKSKQLGHRFAEMSVD
eukprot:PhF_6_TR2550/c0_g1_i1/m.4328